MKKMSTISSLVVRQQKEWGDILTGFETKNRYAVFDELGNRLYLAAEPFCCDGSSRRCVRL